MLDLSDDEPLRAECSVSGQDIVRFLEHAPDFPYAVYAKGSDGPLCRMPFWQLASFVPADIEVSGWVCRGKIWAFYIDEAADIVADSIGEETDADTWHFIRSRAKRICRRCYREKLLIEFERDARLCLKCSTAARAQTAENAANIRRVREIRGGKQHTNEEWNVLFLAFRGKCLRCGSPNDITRDHIVPLAAGGINAIENIQPLCRSCNSWKHMRIIDFRANPRTASE